MGSGGEVFLMNGDDCSMVRLILLTHSRLTASRKSFPAGPLNPQTLNPKP